MEVRTLSTGGAFAHRVATAPWQPGREHLEQSRVARFLQGRAHAGLDEVQARAANDPAWFWSLAMEDLALRWQRQPGQILDTSDGPPFARWWPGGCLNAGAAALDGALRNPTRTVVTAQTEDGRIERLSGQELADRVMEARSRLAALGIEPGARVALLLPMTADAVVLMLALASGEVLFTPIFSGYGPTAIAERVRDLDASHVFTAATSQRRGKVIGLKALADEATADIPVITRVVLGHGDQGGVPWDPARDVWWEQLASARLADGPPRLAVTAATPASTPFMVMYTSGTTGRPKGTVHTHGGFAAKVAQDLAHTFDLREGDTILWPSDLGWLMGPWAVFGALMSGASVVVIDGAPDHPGPDRLWSLASRTQATHIGIGPTLARSLLAHGVDPVRSHDLTRLRVIGSTGEAWDDVSWSWVFERIGERRLPIINYSGGTEVAGGIVGCTVLRPIRSSSFNGPCLGMAAAVLDAHGSSLMTGVGELAVMQPWPGMTAGFWGRPATDFLDTYWRRLPNTWVHGDWAERDTDGFWYVRGRSDDTLNIAGKRLGPVEVENVATRHPAVVEAAALGVPHAVKGTGLVVLCVVRDGDDADRIAAEVSTMVGAALGPTIRPEAVLCVGDLPRTRSGKIVRRAARAALLGHEIGDVSNVENPETLTEIGRRLGPNARLLSGDRHELR